MLTADKKMQRTWQRMASPVITHVQRIASCGLTPQKLTLTLCLGVAFGIIPLVWGTSLICIILAHVFKLNHVALQSLNYLLWPVHLTLLIPFCKLGSWLFPWGPPIPVHLFSALLHTPGPHTLNILGWITLKALAAWFVTVLPAALCTYMVLRITVLRDSAAPSNPLTVHDQDVY